MNTLHLLLLTLGIFSQFQTSFALECTDGLQKLHLVSTPPRTGFIQYGGQRLYVQESGNPNGKPVIILHGRLSGHMQSRHAQIFDPKVYRIIQYDQRGCGNSRPITWAVPFEKHVEDLEKIRSTLNIPFFEVIFGSAFGSTIATSYAIKYGHRVRNLMLNASFLARRSDWEFSYQGDLFNRFPKMGEEFARHIQTTGPAIIDAYYDRIKTGNETRLREEAFWLYAWGQTLIERRDQEIIKPEYGVVTEQQIIAARNFLKYQHHLSRKDSLEIEFLLHRLQEVHVFLFHGEDDLISSIDSSATIDLRAPGSTLYVSEKTGHSMLAPITTHNLVRTAGFIPLLSGHFSRHSAP